MRRVSFAKGPIKKTNQYECGETKEDVSACGRAHGEGVRMLLAGVCVEAFIRGFG